MENELKDVPATQSMDVDECWRLMLRSGFGRLATAAGSQADIFVVNYLVHDRTILFRSAPGTKLVELEEAPVVAFEVDGYDSERYWSVVIRGTAERLTDQREIIRTGVLELVSWSPSDKREFVQIVPISVTGRSVGRAQFGRASLFG
jgi:nitroimidazol reductase NimA-like FMN-containing flavoprotein (pyridoxamine 5'-phosphate oxidase superfamily)